MNNVHLLIEGLLVGTILCETIAILKMRKVFGVLEIDRKGESDRYMFNIFDDLDGLSKRKYVRLKVDNNADLSQK